MKRDLRSKKMPAKPMQEAQADEELELDMPSDDVMSDEELGSEEAEEDFPLTDEESAEDDRFADFSDDEIMEEFQKRGLSLEEPEVEEESEEIELA